MNALKELVAVLIEAAKQGEVGEAVRAWLRVVLGHVDLEEQIAPLAAAEEWEREPAVRVGHEAEVA